MFIRLKTISNLVSADSQSGSMNCIPLQTGSERVKGVLVENNLSPDFPTVTPLYIILAPVTSRLFVCNMNSLQFSSHKKVYM